MPLKGSKLPKQVNGTHKESVNAAKKHFDISPGYISLVKKLLDGYVKLNKSHVITDSNGKMYLKKGDYSDHKTNTNLSKMSGDDKIYERMKTLFVNQVIVNASLQQRTYPIVKLKRYIDSKSEDYYTVDTNYKAHIINKFDEKDLEKYVSNKKPTTKTNGPQTKNKAKPNNENKKHLMGKPPARVRNKRVMEKVLRKENRNHGVKRREGYKILEKLQNGCKKNPNNRNNLSGLGDVPAYIVILDALLTQEKDKNGKGKGNLPLVTNNDIEKIKQYVYKRKSKFIELIKTLLSKYYSLENDLYLNGKYVVLNKKELEKHRISLSNNINEQLNDEYIAYITSIAKKIATILYAKYLKLKNCNSSSIKKTTRNIKLKMGGLVGKNEKNNDIKFNNTPNNNTGNSNNNNRNSTR